MPDRRARDAQASGANAGGALARRAIKDRLQEAVGLALAIDLEVVVADIVPLPAPRPGTLFGSGKVEEIAGLVKANDIGLVIVDHAVSPIQQRNLEKAWACKVLDRTGLILEIFGRRAATREGRLQVELAHLTYQKGRLVRTWTHLERQRGGYGFLGGPGEAQIELDRRMLEERIEKIQKELARVVKTRALHRAGRRRVPFPVVAIVGYTNAGKSTLFNRLTGASVLAKDQVFATLDPTMREIKLPSGRRVILSDTVGFISDLPTALVAAFRATLEEVVAADLILHVRDIAHPETEAQQRDVEGVLGELGIDAEAAATPLLEVWNKADLLSREALLEVRRAQARSTRGEILVSALEGDGLDDLLRAIDARLGGSDEVLLIDVPPREGRLLSWLHDNSEVLDRRADDEGVLTLKVRIDPTLRGKLDGLLQRAAIVARKPPARRPRRRAAE
ncbi:MAG: GTPase HflX [Hyphomicrobiaceae bacterium]|nr:GTPase HflX [Hyphomicrobiaceae bacterium]